MHRRHTRTVPLSCRCRWFDCLGCGSFGPVWTEEGIDARILIAEPFLLDAEVANADPAGAPTNVGRTWSMSAAMRQVHC